MSVTIGLPFFNAERELPDAIRSVFAQSHQDWELILIDDGSTDRSLEIARSVTDPRVKVLSDGRNRRLAARLNQITELSTRPIVARMDADDLMPPGRIARQLLLLNSRPDLDLVSSGLISIDSRYTPTGMRAHPRATITREELLSKTGAGIVHASVMGRRAWFERNRYNPSILIAQDYDLWLRASAANDLKIHILHEPLYYVRELSSVTPSKMYRSYRMDRHAIWRHRRSLWEARFLAKSVVKTAALFFIVSMGRLDWLVRRRSRPLECKALLQSFEESMRIIKATHVPGMSSSV